MVAELKKEKIDFGFVEDVFSEESSGEEEEEVEEGDSTIPPVPALPPTAVQGRM